MNEEKGILIPLSLPESFHNDLQQIKEASSSWAKMIFEGFEYYLQNSRPLVKDRNPEKNKEKFRDKYQFRNTSVYIGPSVYKKIEAAFPEYKINTVFLNLLYFYCRKRSPEYNHSYFSNDLFEKEFKYNRDDYLNAYRYCFSKIKDPVLTQRDYDKERLPNHPTLYNIRKNFKSFSNFITEMTSSVND
ncbi:hypothetical protein [Metabacillus fastidiosus]|uniref:Uncharacterized protein n=1 Tax=Metabacillus fastidiosus TaxID=1458 RepID=A0ABU6P0R4_9BACI|nr:hypothetical protein [Metabacillus fastidiosus]